jgi:hypothetical protein
VHWSPDVHASSSSQASVLFENTQPVAVLQLSVVQKLASSQAIGVPTQAPPEQLSPVVHAFPSEQAFALFAWTQPIGVSHVSVVHTLPSSHSAFVEHVTPMSPGASVIGGPIDIDSRIVDSHPSGLTRRAKSKDIPVPPRLEA